MSTERPQGRLAGALALDPRAYQEIADSPGAIRGAVLIVIGATLLAGLGGLLWTQWGGRTPENAIYATDVQRFIARSVIAGGLIQVALWVVWVLIVRFYLWSFSEPAPIGRLMRVMGYGFAPVGVQLLVFPPGMEIGVAVVAFGYTVAAMVVGVQAAARTSPGRAVTSVLAGCVVFAALLSYLGNDTVDLAPGIFPLDPRPISIGTRELR